LSSAEASAGELQSTRLKAKIDESGWVVISITKMEENLCLGEATAKISITFLFVISNVQGKQPQSDLPCTYS
jgi:hypothetical protein